MFPSNCNFLQVVLINDAYLTEDYIEYLFKYDSTHGPYKGSVKLFDHKLIVDGSYQTSIH